MHILIGLVLALVLLYWWLLGHWFARIVAFLVFAALLGGTGMLFTGVAGPPNDNHAWVGLLLGAALAWPVSGIPVYYWRAKFKEVERT